MVKLFGTDGIRGRVNEWPVTPEMGVRIGKAAAVFFAKEDRPVKIVVGRDTRISGEMLEMAISSGIMSMGGTVLCLHVAPTPAVACLTKYQDADAGIMISASHNPYYDNGVKFFDSHGLKLSVEIEKLLENVILDPETDKKSESVSMTGNMISGSFLIDRYRECLGLFAGDSFDISGLDIVMDCANGAASFIAGEIFSAFGARVTVICDKPDGININHDCGSENTEHLGRMVIEKGVMAGLAFDGDADRLTAVDEKGIAVTGDQIIAICAKRAMELGSIKPGDSVVTTVMSNIGLKIALENMRLKHEITDVGDRNVLFRMIEKCAVIGGEDSGHMIFMDRHMAGDGIYSAMKLLDAIKSSGKPLSELAGVMDVYPQVLVNIDVSSKPELEAVPEIVSAIEKAEAELAGKGRILVRYSGTQPVCRVMVEGQSKEITERICVSIADVIKSVIGIKY